MAVNEDLNFKSLPGTKSAVPFAENQNDSRHKIRRILGIDPGLASTGFGIVDGCMNKYRMVS